MTATVNGLDSVTVGGLALATGLSKSGILTVFGTRDAILLAAVDEARQIYRDTVIRPMLSHGPGRPRLRALIDAWFAYVRDRVFPGGCFVAATSAEYGGRDGDIAAAVRQLKRDWLDLLESEFEADGAADAADRAFELDALLGEANTRYQLFGDERELDRGRRLAGRLIDPA